LKNADVICATLTSVLDEDLHKYIKRMLPNKQFDVVVIDECAQAIEPACWIAI
jgi:superfamily I DNA and/or RNA helicase